MGADGARRSAVANRAADNRRRRRSNDAFPHLAARPVTLLGGRVPGRLFRLSFSGELAYEIAVPAGYGDAVAEALMQAGAPYGICPYGVEAMSVLRIEKGHVTHNEIDGTVTAADLGMGRLVSKTKPDFIGRAMLDREGLNDPDRLRLVGLVPLDPKEICAPAPMFSVRAPRAWKTTRAM